MQSERAIRVRGLYVFEGLRDVEGLLEINAGIGTLGHEIGKHPREIGEILDVGTVATSFRKHCHQPKSGFSRIALRRCAALRREDYLAERLEPQE